MVKDETWSKTGIYEMEHNYFFPYEVFCIYALRLYRKLTQRIATKYNKEFPSEYRFLLTNSFFDFVTSENKESITITEIVKRLFRSEGMKAAFPDEGERIRHILQHQVYGMAPTRIIYLIATNYILGFDETLKTETHNFVQADAAEAAKQGTLQALVDEAFG